MVALACWSRYSTTAVLPCRTASASALLPPMVTSPEMSSGGARFLPAPAFLLPLAEEALALLAAAESSRLACEGKRHLNKTKYIC